ncbi:MAG TPA: DUF2752 domain-containing protein [Verrucomicrobiae bacterium]|nr:DUF2752 domain-containing protein [Verrucomicrobiae bacterium]
MIRAEPGSIPPKIKSAAAPGFGLIAAVAGSVAILGACAVVFFLNPSTHGFYPVCMFHEMTGWNCPGCGGTRSLYSLLHGHFVTALKDNALFILLLPVLALRGAWFAFKRFHGRPTGQFFPAKFLWWLLAVALVFTVLRNLPEFSFLSP